MGNRQTVTIHDVARRVGVSVSTVSNVLTGNRPVAEQTRTRVLQSVDELGFRPNRLARGLVNRSSKTLGVVAAGLEYYGPSRTLVGMEQQASEMDYSLILSLIHDPETEEVEPVVANLLTHQVDGIIWSIPQIGRNRAWWERFYASLRVPVVFLDMEPRSNFVKIDVDNRGGGRMATEHLIANGYRRIGLITGPLDWWAARQRKEGWQDALSAAGLPGNERQVTNGDWKPASGERALRELLEKFPEMDAVFVSNDQMALGAMRTARAFGVRIPQDLAMVGYDDVPEAEYLYPPLTTVRQQVLEMGKLAVRELTRLIGCPEDGVAQAPTDDAKLILLQPELVVRASARVG